MSKTALLEAVRRFDIDTVRRVLHDEPSLKAFRSEHGFNLLQICCHRSRDGDRAAGGRQLRMARWFVAEGFDPRILHTTAPGEDGEEDVAHLSLVWFAVAKAQNTALARYFLEHGAAPNAFFAAAWWSNWEILEDLVEHGGNINEVVGATPLHMAVDLLDRGVEGKPERARRRTKCVKEMLRLGADPNIPAVNGETPLHTALDKGDLSVFKLLLQHGANPDAPGKAGRTVREIAARKRDKRFVEALAG